MDSLIRYLHNITIQINLLCYNILKSKQDINYGIKTAEVTLTKLKSY